MEITIVMHFLDIPPLDMPPLVLPPPAIMSAPFERSLRNHVSALSSGASTPRLSIHTPISNFSGPPTVHERRPIRLEPNPSPSTPKITGVFIQAVGSTSTPASR